MPGLAAVRALVSLNLGQRESPRPVLVEPQRLARGDDPAEENRPGDPPRPRCLYFAAMRESRIPESASEKGMPGASTFTS